MSYNSLTQFRNYALSAATFQNTGSYPDSMVQAVLDDSQSIIDAALYVHHNLPLASGSVPNFIYKAERDLTAYNLLLISHFDPSKSESDRPILDAYFRVAGSPDHPNSGMLWEIREGRLQIPQYSKNTNRPGEVKVIQIPPRSYGSGRV